MKTSRSTQRYLALDELSPVVDLAGCWHYEHDQWSEYRIPSFHIMLVESGRLLNETPPRRFEARAGDLICLPPTEFNSYATRGATVYYQAHIAFAPPPRHRLGPWLDEAGPLPLHLPLHDSFNAMRQVFETLCIELGQGGSGPSASRAAVHEMLAIIIDVGRRRGSGIRHLDNWQRARLRPDPEWGANLKIEQLASKMGVSTDHFIRRFKQRFGMSPKVYQTHARLREAVRLLRSTEKSAKTIAYEMGFADPKSFFRLFKKHLGVVPSDLRLPGSRHAGKPLPVRSKSLFPINRHVFFSPRVQAFHQIRDPMECARETAAKANGATVML